MESTKAKETSEIVKHARNEYNYRWLLERLYEKYDKFILQKSEVEQLLGLSESSMSNYIAKGIAPKKLAKSGKHLFPITYIAEYILDTDIPSWTLKLNQQELRDSYKPNSKELV